MKGVRMGALDSALDELTQPSIERHPMKKPTKKKATSKRKAKARKRTSDRVSKIAGKILRRLRDEPGRNKVFPLENGLGMIDAGCVVCSVAELKSLAASALAQDEVEGPRK